MTKPELTRRQLPLATVVPTRGSGHSRDAKTEVHMLLHVEDNVTQKCFAARFCKGASNSEPVLASKLLHVSTQFRSCVGNPTIYRRWTQVSAALISKTRQQNPWTATRRDGQVLHSIFMVGFNWTFSMFQLFCESPIDTGAWLQFEVAATK